MRSAPRMRDPARSARASRGLAAGTSVVTALLLAVTPLLVAAALLLVAVVLPAPPAHAHSRVSEYASNEDSRITAAPELPGVRWRLHAGGLLVEVENRGPEDLIVLGYEGEPYLRVGPEGAFVNRRSPATYLNAERYGDVAVPPIADAGADPEWVRTGHRPRAVWHDHRTHWMAPDAPAVAQQDPDRVHHLHTWSVPLLVGGEAHALAGELRWLPTPSPWPWLLAALVLTAPAAAGLWRVRRAARGPSASADESRALLRPAALVVGLVALANAAHLPDELLAQPAPALDVGFGMLHTALFVGTGLVGALVAWRGRGGARAGLGVASGALLFHQGLLHVPSLAAAVLPTALPDGLFRLLVAVALVQALPVAAVLVASARRQRDVAQTPADGTDVTARMGPSTPRAGRLNV